jgi:hypothetical protein
MGILLVGTAGGTSISNTILTYLSGVSSNIQTQFSNTCDLSTTQTVGGNQNLIQMLLLYHNGLVAGSTQFK